MYAQCSRRPELSTTMHHDQVAASETQSSDHKKSIMFIGDRGCGVGSPIKGHQQFGSTWKQKLHGRYTPALVINEYNFSQTCCLFCFQSFPIPWLQSATRSKPRTGLLFVRMLNAPSTYTVVCRDQVSAKSNSMVSNATNSTNR